jgi:glyoxylase-like metal-dependent hydrolase (beta-lactamase superfamily II)
MNLRGVRLGHTALDYELLVFPHPEIALTAPRQEGSKIWYHCPVMSFVLELEDGLVLWETGVSPLVRDEWLPSWQVLVDVSNITPEVCLEARLRSIGYAPEDFKYVVMGHLHADHAGGLRLFEDSGATIICHEDEYRHVMQIERADNFYVRADWNFLGRKKPTTVYGDQEIFKDVWTVSLPGHTPGSIGLKVRLPHTGTVFLTSDALYTHRSYGPPPVGSPIVWNSQRWAESVEKIRRLASVDNGLVMPGHDLTGMRHEGTAVKLQEIEFSPDYVYE